MARHAALAHPTALALREAALGYPDTTEDHPWGETAFKVRGRKAFCFMAGTEEGGFVVTFKLPFRAEDALAQPFAEPTGYGMGPSGWVTCRFGPDDAPPLELLCDWLDESWRAVAPKRLAQSVSSPW